MAPDPPLNSHRYLFPLSLRFEELRIYRVASNYKRVATDTGEQRNSTLNDITTLLLTVQAYNWFTIHCSIYAPYLEAVRRNGSYIALLRIPDTWFDTSASHCFSWSTPSWTCFGKVMASKLGTHPMKIHKYCLYVS